MSAEIFNSFIKTPHNPLDKATPEEIHKMALTASNNMAIMIAQHPEALPKTFSYLAKDAAHGSLNWIYLVQNPKLPAKTLLWIYRQVTTPSLVKFLYEIASDIFLLRSENTMEILRHIAVHPNTPEKVIAKLSKHKNPAIRFAVVDNPLLRANARVTIINDIIAHKGYGDTHLFLQALGHATLHTDVRNVLVQQIIDAKIGKELNQEDKDMLEEMLGFPALNDAIKPCIIKLLKT